ncbi:glycosyltransferase [Marinobacter sp.]|uniref:glycosyltransferase n=1 Tax=Marinobacter sp. TaxID=50741 RepID=UPI003A95CA6D
MATPPIFSIIIPARDEEEAIPHCLNSLFSLTFPIDKYEVILIDNGSTDDTVDIAKKYPNLKILYKPNCNVGAVRNFGAKNSLGHYLVFIDADCVIHKDWLSNSYDLVSNEPETVFGGGAMLPFRPKWIEKYWLLGSEKNSILPSKLIGASIVIPRNVFFNVGGFDELLTSGEDSLLHENLNSKKYTIKITNKIDVIHLGNAKTVKEFIKRQVWHSENYASRISQSIKDPIFLLASLFMITGSALLINLLTLGLKTPSTITLMTLFLAAPMALSIKRIKRSNSKLKNIKNLPAIYLIDIIYLTGRSWGILKGLFNKLI